MLLEFQLLENLLRHVFVLPCVSSHSLELDAVQGKEWDLDDKDLKLHHHATAQIALHLRRRLSRHAPRYSSTPSGMLSTDSSELE